MTLGAWVVVAAVAAALLVGAWRMRADGRFRRPGSEGSSVLGGTSYDAQRGERATLLQFSSAFCAPCRAARRVLGEVAESEPGVRHVEVDAESHLDLVRTLGILRTPTTLVLDGTGREVARASGAPRRAQVLAVLTERIP